MYRTQARKMAKIEARILRSKVPPDAAARTMHRVTASLVKSPGRVSSSQSLPISLTSVEVSVPFPAWAGPKRRRRGRSIRGPALRPERPATLVRAPRRRDAESCRGREAHAAVGVTMANPLGAEFKTD